MYELPVKAGSLNQKLTSAPSAPSASTPAPSALPVPQPPPSEASPNSRKWTQLSTDNSPAPATGGAAAAAEQAGDPNYPKLNKTHLYGWSPRNLDPAQAIVKMKLNLFKAINEHRVADPKNAAAYVTVEEAQLLDGPAVPVGKIAITEFSNIGRNRKAMEDAHFCLDSPGSTLVGVFDGHGGADVAKFARDFVRDKFDGILKKKNGNVHAALEEVIDQCQAAIMKNDGIKNQGSTAVITYIDKTNGLIYTATVGDSETTIYRDVYGTLKSFPISTVRDWKSPNDFMRWKRAHEFGLASRGWDTKPAKQLRSQIITGVNVARTLGDSNDRSSCMASNKNPLVISKPKITVARVKSGDTVIIACDGLTDFVPEGDIVDEVAKKSDSSLAERLGKKAITNMKETEGGDNVTVVVIHIPGAAADAASGAAAAAAAEETAS